MEYKEENWNLNSNKFESKSLIFEACVGSLEEAVKAEALGASRVELCADLKNAGVTPSEECILAAKKFLRIPVFVIIRPTFWDFFYSNNEFEEMKQQILFCKDNNIDGVVFGILKYKNTGNSLEIDFRRNKILADLAKPMKITFHMAFDLIGENKDLSPEENLKEKFSAIEKLIELKFDRILTKGCADNAVSGKHNLKRLIEFANERIIIMPGGGITEVNKYELARFTNAKELHGTKIVGALI